MYYQAFILRQSFALLLLVQRLLYQHVLLQTYHKAHCIYAEDRTAGRKACTAPPIPVEEEACATADKSYFEQCMG